MRNSLLGPLLSLVLINCSPLVGFQNDADAIPKIGVAPQGWSKISNVAQYRLSDWSNVVGQAKNVSLDEAIQIAENDPTITFFFHVKGYQLELENLEVEPNIWRVFNYGDAIFFTGEPWWGSAADLADGYVKSVN